MKMKKATEADLLEELHEFRLNHGCWPRAISFHPEFRNLLVANIKVTKAIGEPYKRRYHDIPFLVNPKLESAWLLIKPEEV